MHASHAGDVQSMAGWDYACAFVQKVAEWSREVLVCFWEAPACHMNTRMHCRLCALSCIWHATDIILDWIRWRLSPSSAADM